MLHIWHRKGKMCHLNQATGVEILQLNLIVNRQWKTQTKMARAGRLTNSSSSDNRKRWCGKWLILCRRVRRWFPISKVEFLKVNNYLTVITTFMNHRCGILLRKIKEIDEYLKKLSRMLVITVDFYFIWSIFRADSVFLLSFLPFSSRTYI